MKRHILIIASMVVLAILIVILSEITTFKRHPKNTQNQKNTQPTHRYGTRIDVAAVRRLINNFHSSKSKSAQLNETPEKEEKISTDVEALDLQPVDNHQQVEVEEASEKKPKAAPYPSFGLGRWPDTPENRALMARFDENCEYYNKVLAPVRVEVARTLQEVFDSYLERHEISYREFKELRDYYWSLDQELTAIANEMDEECREIMKKLRASRAEYRKKYGR